MSLCANPSKFWLIWFIKQCLDQYLLLIAWDLEHREPIWEDNVVPVMFLRIFSGAHLWSNVEFVFSILLTSASSTPAVLIHHVTDCRLK